MATKILHTRGNPTKQEKPQPKRSNLLAQEYEDRHAAALAIECRFGTMCFSTDLQFGVSKDDVTATAADSLEAFARELCEIAGHIRKFGETLHTLKVRTA